jgi:hypothetical protein
MKLLNTENNLVGQWLFDNGKLHNDEVALRIDWLIHNYLKKLASDTTGWYVLYEDPNDKRFWELTYPHSELQGGGPPSLKQISIEEARQKYSLN